MPTDRYTRDVLIAHLEEMRKRVDSLGLTFQDREDAIRLAVFSGRIASLRKLIRAVKLPRLTRETIAEMCGDIHADIEREAGQMESRTASPCEYDSEGSMIQIGSMVRRKSGGGSGKVESFHKKIVGRVLTFDARISWIGGGNTLEPIANLIRSSQNIEATKLEPVDRILPACTCSKYIAGDGSWCPRHG